MDLIERQAALDAFDKQYWNLLDIPICKEIRDAAKRTIKALPAVQPEPKPDKNGSEPFGNAEMLGDRTTDDCISRQAAIDEAEEWIEVVYCEDGDQRERDAIRHVIKGIKKLPSVQPQPEECDTCKHGYFGDRQCDNCRVRYPSHYEREEEQNGSD